MERTFPLVAKRYGPGRHEGQTNIEAKVADLALDGCDEAGDMDTTGHYALVRFDEGERRELGEITEEDGSPYFDAGEIPVAAIVATNSQGFVNVTYSTDEAEVAARWAEIEAETNEATPEES